MRRTHHSNSSNWRKKIGKRKSNIYYALPFNKAFSLKIRFIHPDIIQGQESKSSLWFYDQLPTLVGSKLLEKINMIKRRQWKYNQDDQLAGRYTSCFGELHSDKSPDSPRQWWSDEAQIKRSLDKVVAYNMI